MFQCNANMYVFYVQCGLSTVPFQQFGCKWVLTASSLGHAIKWFDEATSLHSHLQDDHEVVLLSPYCSLGSDFWMASAGPWGRSLSGRHDHWLVGMEVPQPLSGPDQRFVGYGTNWWSMIVILIAFMPGPHILNWLGFSMCLFHHWSPRKVVSLSKADLLPSDLLPPINDRSTPYWGITICIPDLDSHWGVGKASQAPLSQKREESKPQTFLQRKCMSYNFAYVKSHMLTTHILVYSHEYWIWSLIETISGLYASQLTQRNTYDGLTYVAHLHKSRHTTRQGHRLHEYRIWSLIETISGLYASQHTRLPTYVVQYLCWVTICCAPAQVVTHDNETTHRSKVIVNCTHLPLRLTALSFYDARPAYHWWKNRHSNIDLYVMPPQQIECAIDISSIPASSVSASRRASAGMTGTTPH